MTSTYVYYLLLLTILLSPMGFPSSASLTTLAQTEEKETETAYNWEKFRVEELETQPDVMLFLQKNGFGQYLLHEGQTFEEISKVYDVSALEKPNTGSKIETDEKKRLREMYGLEEPHPIYHQQIIVQRNIRTAHIERVTLISFFSTTHNGTTYTVHLQANREPVIEKVH